MTVVRVSAMWISCSRTTLLLALVGSRLALSRTMVRIRSIIVFLVIGVFLMCVYVHMLSAKVTFFSICIFERCVTDKWVRC